MEHEPVGARPLCHHQVTPCQLVGHDHDRGRGQLGAKAVDDAVLPPAELLDDHDGGVEALAGKPVEAPRVGNDVEPVSRQCITDGAIGTPARPERADAKGSR